MQKSVVFTVTTDLSHDQRMARIAGTLAQAGFDVTLVGRALPGSKPLEKKPYHQVRLAAIFQKGPLFYLEYNLRLVIWFLKRPFQIYGAIDADTALAGIVTSWCRRKPLVYDAHELFPEMPEVVHRRFVKKVWATFEKYAFRRARLSYTVSASLVHYFEQKYGVPVALIRNLPLPQAGMPQPAWPRYFIYQGALNVGRGLECVLEAMRDVPAQLVICGDGPLAAALKDQVEKAGLQDKVIFKGNISPPELAKLTATAWAGIMLLENQGLSYYYSLANKFFDYVQAGIPQVCVPFPEYVQLNQEHEVALLAQPEVGEVREALTRLLENPETYQRLQQNCLQARQHWHWQAEGQRLVELYRRLSHEQ